MVDSKRGRGLACTFCYAGVVVVVMVTCQQSQCQRSGLVTGSRDTLWGGGGCHGDVSTKPANAKVKGQRAGLFIDRNKR